MGPGGAGRRDRHQRTACGAVIPAPAISIVIPTRNGGRVFRDRVWPAVLDQHCDEPYEVVVVDSRSEDGSNEMLRLAEAEDPRVRLFTIDPAEFGHGKTRNFAISQSRGEIVALLTQDAQPADAQWLNRLTASVRQDDAVAGAVGRQVPYPDANLTSRRELFDHFEGMRAWPQISRIDDRYRYDTDIMYRRAFHFFSNNNAAIRRRVWNDIPYPDVPFGEDQIWAEHILKAGYAKAYADDAVVFHSHEFSCGEMYRRQKIETGYYCGEFGYQIVPRLRNVPRTVYDHVRADFNYWSLHARDELSRTSMLRSIPLNVARALGQFAGTRLANNERASTVSREAT